MRYTNDIYTPSIHPYDLSSLDGLYFRSPSSLALTRMISVWLSSGRDMACGAWEGEEGLDIFVSTSSWILFS